MEFATNAPKSLYASVLSNPLYPCSSLEAKYKESCARNQPQVMQKYLGMSLDAIANVCLSSSDTVIRYHCIDALGLKVGQESYGDANFIVNQCSQIPNQEAIAQCASAAAGELVFQNYKGWQDATKKVCGKLTNVLKKSCDERVNQTISTFYSTP